MHDINEILKGMKDVFGDSVVFHEKKEDFVALARESASNFLAWVEGCGYNDDVFKLFALHSKDAFDILVDVDGNVAKVGAIGRFPSDNGDFIDVGIGMPLQFPLENNEKIEESPIFLDAILIMFQLANKLDSFLEKPAYIEKIRAFAKKYSF